MEDLETALRDAVALAYHNWGILGAIGVLVLGIALIFVLRYLGYVWRHRREVCQWIVEKCQRNSRFQGVRAAAILSTVCAVVLIISALADWPYFMYVLLRMFICCSSAYLAVKVFSQNRFPLTWLFGAIGVLFNPILPVRMSRSDWEATNGVISLVFLAISVFLIWDSLIRRPVRGLRHIAEAVLAAGHLCDEMKGLDTRILELDPTDSALANFFVVTSATDQRQAAVIADIVKRKLLSEYDLTATTEEGYTSSWILLNYGDFDVHIFVAEKRNFYNIERLRKCAISFTLPEFGKVVKNGLHVHKK